MGSILFIMLHLPLLIADVRLISLLTRLPNCIKLNVYGWYIIWCQPFISNSNLRLIVIIEENYVNYSLLYNQFELVPMLNRLIFRFPSRSLMKTSTTWSLSISSMAKLRRLSMKYSISLDLTISHYELHETASLRDSATRQEIPLISEVEMISILIFFLAQVIKHLRSYTRLS